MLFDHPARLTDWRNGSPGASESRVVKLPTGTLPDAPAHYAPDKVFVKLPREKQGEPMPVAENERYAWSVAQSLGWDIVPEVLDPRCVFPGTAPDGVVVTRWLAHAQTGFVAPGRRDDHPLEYLRERTFEYLIRKGDTHEGNFVWAAGRCWSIDHDVLDGDGGYAEREMWCDDIRVELSDIMYGGGRLRTEIHSRISQVLQLRGPGIRRREVRMGTQNRA